MLRREYYDPMDKPGMAEIIIAKNPHGSIGNVTLTYRKEIVQFANYTPLKYENSFDRDPDPAFSQFTP
jgi:replicative DNA helicase